MGAVAAFKCDPKPHLKEVSSTPHSARIPACVVDESRDQFQIIINMSGGAKSHLQLLSNEHGHRLNVIGEKFCHTGIDHFLMTFGLPKNAEWRLITMGQRLNFYLIYIPKRKFWDRVGTASRRLASEGASF